MADGAARIEGRHDFRSFCASGSDVTDFERTVQRIEVARDGDIVEIWVEADGFLYKMVRNIVGTLVEVGRGRMAPETVAQVIAAKDRRAAAKTAPPQGLSLIRVQY